MVSSDVEPDAFFAQSALPMAMVGLDGRLLAVNQSLCTLVSRDQAQLVGGAALDLCAHDAGRQVAVGLIDEARSGARSTARLDLELWVGKDETRTVTLDASLVRPGGAQAPYIAVVFVDHLAPSGEECPSSSQRRWRAALADAADVTLAASPDGTIHDVTSGVRMRFGWDEDRLVGTQVNDLVHPDDQEVFRQSWQRVTAGAAERDWVEHRWQQADGDWRWVRTTIASRAGDAVVATVVDVTARKELERARTRQDARMRARFALSKIAKADVDRDGRLIEMNDAFVRLLGRSRADLLGVHAVDLLHPDPLNGTVLPRVLAGELEAARAQRRLSTVDGAPRPVLVDLTLLRDGEGRPDGGALIVIDLSRLRDSERRLQEQTDFFHALSLRSTDAALMGDADGQILYASPSVRSVFGYEPTDVIGHAGWEFLHPDDLPRLQHVYADVVAHGGSRSLVVRARHADGRWLWIEETVTNLLQTAIGGVVANLRDVTQRVTAEQALLASEARYRAIADTAEEGILTVSPEGVTTYVNGKMAQILGVSAAELYGRRPSELLGPAQAAEVRQRAIERATRGTERYEVTYAHPDGGERTLLVVASPLPDTDGARGGSLAMVSDVTDARRAEADLRRAALHDALTGLPNRSLLLDRLTHALAKQAAGAHASTALLFLDLDQFKLVNDSRGHELGDRLLVAVAERLALHTRPEDTVARFGGDEFVVVCEGVSELQAQCIADGLLAALAEPFDIDGELLHTSASIGIAASPPVSGEDLLRYADAAMYTAKGAGRGRARAFDRELADQVDRRYALGVDLRAALAAGELELHYQPVIELSSGAVVGMEALARWHHPVHGNIPPAQFVGIADQVGLAAQLDTWALQTAAADVAELRRAQRVPLDAYVAINLSARNITSPDLEQTVVSATASGELEAQHVVLELTESAVMDDAERAVQVLRRLRERGFGIAIDDFGTGYSSLAYLKALPMTSLKIDRSFVADIAEDSDALAIVASIVDLARAVGVATIAEGVETAQQLALLRRLGCTAAQGWLWSRAVPVRDLLRDAGPDWQALQLSPTAEASAVPPRRAPAAEVRVEHGLDRLLALHQEGASLVTIAAALNREGFRTPAQTRWHRTTVARAIARAAYPDLAGGR